MLGSVVLDVAIGITLLFLFVSLICSAMREAVETVLKSRAMDLERGIRELLQDKTGRQITEKLYKHPFVFSLYAGTYDPDKLKRARLIPGAADSLVMPWRARGSLPAYIPSQAFSAAMIDLIREEAGKGEPLSMANLRKGAELIANEGLKTAVLAALNGADDDIPKLRRSIENWYDATMDRVSGWYKRRTQYILLAFGLIAAVAFNIDPLHIARRLATDKAYRDAVVAQVPAIQAARNGPAEAKAPDEPMPEQAARTAPATASTEPTLKDALARMKTIEAELDRSDFLLGWWPPQLPNCDGTVASMTTKACALPAAQMVLGWLVTAFAVSLGAPFWFDVLNKFMIVRSTVKPAEKSGEEGSKDSTAKGKGLTVPLTFTMHQPDAAPPTPPGSP